MAAAAVLAAIYIANSANAEPITVTAKPVPLDTSDASRDKAGGITYQGGLRLRSDARGFGGFSGLDVSADGTRLIAVSDFGRRLDARLSYSGGGRLTGIAGARLTALTGPGGKPLNGKGDGDAEDIARLGGALLVVFERRHRILSYGPGPVRAVPPPPGLEKAPANGGIEALTALPGGRLLAILEAATAVPGGARSGVSKAWMRSGGRWAELTYARTGSLSPAGAATVPAGKGAGDVLIVERHWSLLAGTRVRIARLTSAALARAAANRAALKPQEIARLEAPLTVDNFEGIAVRRGADGATFVYLISDDNFNPLQETLLLLFRLDG